MKTKEFRIVAHTGEVEFKMEECAANAAACYFIELGADEEEAIECIADNNIGTTVWNWCNELILVSIVD